VERACRRSALAFTRWCLRRGLRTTEIAERIGVSPRTLRRWEKEWSEDRMRLHPRGRPPECTCRKTRQEILATFALLGPRVGLPTLQGLFPDVARGELIELQRRYRHAFKRKRKYLLHVLQWTTVGAVWAMDFTDPPAPIEGNYPKIFCVRDLTSGKQLAALPAENATSRLVMTVLEALVRWYGIPLVIKCDNDSAFRNDDVKAWGKKHSVLFLYSPEGTPEYNGAIEAGIGSLKTRALHEAARYGRPGDWTCNDVQAAADQANETGRPNGKDGRTPDESWNTRIPVGEEERKRFLLAYRSRYIQECRHRGISWPARLEEREHVSVARVAIGQAMIDEGFLLIRRRRVSLPFKRWKVANIS
jgi:transposase InsO family protein